MAVTRFRTHGMASPTNKANKGLASNVRKLLFREIPVCVTGTEKLAHVYPAARMANEHSLLERNNQNT